MLPKAVFYANSGSRQSEELFPLAVKALEIENVALEEAQTYDDVEFMRAQIRHAAREGAKLIIIGGGDGTVSAMSSVVAELDLTLGVMPLGTANQFCLELGIEKTVEAAAKVIGQGRTCRVDMGEVNGNTFINVATLGITTEIARSLRYKKELGTAAYIPAVIQSFHDLKTFEAEITYQNVIETEEVFLLVVCNGRHHAGPFVSSPDASLTNGTLDAYMVEPTNMWKLIQVGAMALTGDHVDMEPVHLVTDKQFTVTTKPAKPITMDGETAWFDIMDFKSRPAALNVCVPEEFHAPPTRVGSLLQESSSS